MGPSVFERCVYLDEFTFSTINKGKVDVKRLAGTRYDEENVQPVDCSNWQTATYMMGFSYLGVLDAFRANGTGANFVFFLENFVLPYGNAAFGTDLPFFIIMDNAPWHDRCILVRTWLVDHADRIVRLPHPPHSPDLNPCEHLGAHIKNEINDVSRRFKLNNDVEVMTAVTVTHILYQDSDKSHSDCEAWAGSMHRRYDECLNANGGYTSH